VTKMSLPAAKTGGRCYVCQNAPNQQLGTERLSRPSLPAV
jgi:hypothetical protein